MTALYERLPLGVSVCCRRLWSLVILLLLFPGILPAQYQKTPPDFGGTYSFPSPSHPEPITDWLRMLDVALLTVAIGAAAWFILKSRNRKAVTFLSIASVAYFGFYRNGCICSVGAIQNVVLCLANPQYIMSFSVIAIFFIPLVATLLFGRVFCGGVCPLGALQDLVLIKPMKVPVKLDKALRSLQFIYLGLAVLFAGWGLHLQLGGWKLNLKQQFLICDWDPFVPVFRLSGPISMIAVSAAFLIVGMFIGRPYCRWLCPYGGILSVLSRVAWKNVSITPDKELDCGRCADACPYGAIRNLRADRGSCLACTRCYEFCPRQKRLVALQTGSKPKPASVAAPPGGIGAIARTWIGISSLLLIVVAGSVLATTYVRSRRALPAETALIESLREQSKTDAEVQKVLQPELSRQHEAGVTRRRIYSLGSWVLLISAAMLILWANRLRPASGAGAGAPRLLLAFIERPPDQRKKV